jgi:hypothetical protein
VPRSRRARVNKAAAEFDVYLAEIEVLAEDLQNAASDAD